MSDSSPPSPNPPKQDLSWLGYVCAGLSFIPCLGVPFGLVAIVFGVVRSMRAVLVLGICGIAFTFILYGGLFYFGMFQRGGVYDQLRAKMAVTMLNSSVKEIEFYKLQHGTYPHSLDDLSDQEKNGFPSTSDPTAIERGGKMDEKFYYQLDPSGKFYYLRSVGPDGVPFTNDDILPALSDSELKNTGLRLDKAPLQPASH
jgi:hypothetical protein